MNLNLLDLLIIFSLLYYIIRGFFTGLVRAGLELIGLLVSAHIAANFFIQLADLLRPYTLGLNTLTTFVSYVIIFVAVYQVFAYTLQWLDQTQWKNQRIPFIYQIRTAFGGLLEHGGGMLVGLIKGNIFIGVTLLLLISLNLSGQFADLIRTSQFAGYMTSPTSDYLPDF